jgi:hypothetical protein
LLRPLPLLLPLLPYLPNPEGLMGGGDFATEKQSWRKTPKDGEGVEVWRRGMTKCNGVGVVRVVATLGPNVCLVVMMMTRLADFACADWS